MAPVKNKIGTKRSKKGKKITTKFILQGMRQQQPAKVVECKNKLCLT